LNLQLGRVHRPSSRRGRNFTKWVWFFDIGLQFDDYLGLNKTELTVFNCKQETMCVAVTMHRRYAYGYQVINKMMSV